VVDHNLDINFNDVTAVIFTGKFPLC